MNNTDQIAAEQLLNNRIKTPKKLRLATELRPQNSEQALQIQSETIKLRSDEVAGWKCSLPLNEDQLIVAPLFSDTVQSGQQCSLFSENGKARVEPEIAFILGADLPASTNGYSEAEIDAAVDRCHMALELMQDRFSGQSDVSFYEKLADCLVNQGLFIGPEIDKASAYLANEFTITFNQEKNKQRFAGKHPNQLPQKPLHWLINYMSQRGVSFTAGQAIITGSYAGVVEVDFNCLTEIEYEGLGKYQVTFIEDSV
ncbi:hydratase [Psychromonas sp. Urea-02u-13]|uniref:hydratase n=1 Tax=Psychromonas sp. Urea-02u-13 TaxID=2058326 RepID=UPI000C34C31B|nr:hydratase [Psychromonas sp. Urea-02u-13]PKG38798.1 hydratase [Psychromonas sp. Urea-02u-13]